MDTKEISSGIPALDRVVMGLRAGDNVVWQVDQLDNYLDFARPFAERARADGRRLIYLRFAPHPLVLPPSPGHAIPGRDPYRLGWLLCTP